MRTLVMIGVGLAIMAGFLLAGRLLRLAGVSVPVVALFIGVWFVWCLWDTYLGTTHGYAWGAELLIHAPIFLVPALAAWWLGRVLA
ncbi:MAG: hypothetical protein IT556_04075 [Acetobacteraceae bacterium]|nr:hypothetical protein [Acetobacteraceae bacterium]